MQAKSAVPVSHLRVFGSTDARVTAAHQHFVHMAKHYILHSATLAPDELALLNAQVAEDVDEFQLAQVLYPCIYLAAEQQILDGATGSC